MVHNNIFGFLTDKGGRRKIKDRRYMMSGPPGAERRTGQKRRSGLDRRFRACDPDMPGNRRQQELKDAS